jgi:hypothetical protein
MVLYAVVVIGWVFIYFSRRERESMHTIHIANNKTKYRMTSVSYQQGDSKKWDSNAMHHRRIYYTYVHEIVTNNFN